MIEFDLGKVLRVLFSKIWIIVISCFLCACFFFSYAYYFISPKYQSSALFYVNNNNLNIGSISYSISSSDISASQSLVDTYIVILKTRNTLEAVIEKAGLDYEYEKLVKMVSADSINNTEVFEVKVTSEDAKEACVIANTIASVLPDKISEIVTGSGAKIVDYAVINPSKVSPSIPLYIVAGAMVGLVISCILILFADHVDDTIYVQNDAKEIFDNIPTLAIIPDLNSASESHYYRKS